jgi:hypothetical protein
LNSCAANAQSNAPFAPGEVMRVYNLLEELGCIGNMGCGLRMFTEQSDCEFKIGFMKCDAQGQLSYL